MAPSRKFESESINYKNMLWTDILSAPLWTLTYLRGLIFTFSMIWYTMLWNNSINSIKIALQYNAIKTISDVCFLWSSKVVYLCASTTIYNSQPFTRSPMIDLRDHPNILSRHAWIYIMYLFIFINVMQTPSGSWLTNLTYKYIDKYIAWPKETFPTIKYLKHHGFLSRYYTSNDVLGQQWLHHIFIFLHLYVSYNFKNGAFSKPDLVCTFLKLGIFCRFVYQSKSSTTDIYL